MLYYLGIIYHREDTKMIFLSIIIPVYNAAYWLGGCLDSLLSTIPDMNAVQIILVDDGSTDGSSAICDQYAQQCSAIQVIHQANGGVSAARNTGLMHVQGEYIAWVDPDDYVSSDWFSSIRSAILSCHPDVVVFDTRRFDVHEETQEIYGRSPGLIDMDLFLTDLYRDARMLSGLPNKVIRAKHFSGVSFDTELTVLEDFAAMPKIMSQAKSVYYIPKTLYHYRQHGASLLHRADSQRAFSSFRTACARVAEVPDRYRTVAKTCAAMQAFAYCYHHCATPDFNAKPEHLRQCKGYMLRQLPAICADRELTAFMKLKYALMLTGITRMKYLPKRGT